jgi:hypothetical protein
MLCIILSNFSIFFKLFVNLLLIFLSLLFFIRPISYKSISSISDNSSLKFSKIISIKLSLKTKNARCGEVAYGARSAHASSQALGLALKPDWNYGHALGVPYFFFQSPLL